MKKIFLLSCIMFLQIAVWAQPDCIVLKVPLSFREYQSFTPLTLPDSSAWIGVYYETDYAIYLDCQSDTNKVKARLMGWFNGVRKLYSKSGIRIYIAGYKIWKKPDPYMSAMNSSQALNLFSYRMDSIQYPADQYQLLSMHCQGCGGISYVNALSAPAAYRCSMAGMLSGNESNGEAYPLSWNIMVMAHEMGHNIACQHTHTMYWNGDNTMIDSCACAANSGYCPPGSYVGGGNEALPTNGGTIMSYCHLLNTQISGIKGFGPQPTLALRNAVESVNLAGGLTNPNGINECDPSYCYTDNISGLLATIHWSSNSGNFKYHYRVKGTSTWSALFSTASHQVTLSGLSPFTIYEWRVKSKCGIFGAWTKRNQFKTQ